MRCAFALLSLFVLAAVCRGQQPTQQPTGVTQQPAGLENPWDVQTILKKIDQDNADLKTLLDGLKPQQWVSQKGAPTTYLLQWQSTEQQLHDIGISSGQLARATDSLPLALDNYFRLEALDVTSRNIEEGARHYADRSSADKLTALIARNFNDRERFRQYLKDLASSFEQNYKIADEEAQRCRGMISKEPASRARKTHK